MKACIHENKKTACNRLLILSDGKPGHVNQAVAFAKHLDLCYDLIPISFRCRFYKGLSFLADYFHVFSTNLFVSKIPSKNRYAAVVSAGSETYYANKTLAKRLGCKSIAIMLPRGYRLDFDLIIAQEHDNPPQRDHIIRIPINLTYPESRRVAVPQEGKPLVGIIVGGDSGRHKMNSNLLEGQINRVLELFPKHAIWMTTSRRTPTAVEEMLGRYPFDMGVFFSKTPVNPIPDFLQYCEYVFLTADSSSMISEAVSYGQAFIEVLPLAGQPTRGGKIDRFIEGLEKRKFIHVFDGEVGQADKKINLSDFLRGIEFSN